MFHLSDLRFGALLSTLCALLIPGALWAQTDFYNLEKGRPFRVEDAFTGKHRGLELKGSPLTLIRGAGGGAPWESFPSLELKAGLFPGFEGSIGVERDALELSSLLNLWVESPTLPAAALRITSHTPFQSEEGSGSVEVRGILTRSLAEPFRLHLNAGVTAGDAADQAWVGGALDWIFPFHHTLLLAEGWMGFPEEGGSRAQAGLGVRTQLSPTLVLDAGVARGLSGSVEGRWTLNVGLTREFGLAGWRGTPRTPAAGAPIPARGAVSAPAAERVGHPFPLVAGHNRVFRDRYPEVDRLFNAFDYGHGVLYETLWSNPDAPASLLEETIYHRLVEEILPSGPRLPMPETAFMPQYGRLAPRAREMFEWAHILHRQSYDLLADPTLSEAERDLAMDALLDNYTSSPLAFPSQPKGMEIMDEQYFSKAFREAYPRFNGLIWAYHWLQIAVYEPLLAYDDPVEQRAAMQATVARFWQMLADPPGALPSEMPMAPAVAPVFTARYPRLAAIFDNLHMMHDVISDILVSDTLGRDEVRGELYRQIALFLDPEAMAVSDEAWIAMALAHGVDAQGGPALGWFPEAATRGATGAHSDHHHHP